MTKHNLELTIGRTGQESSIVIDGVNISDRTTAIDIHIEPSAVTTITIEYVNLDKEPIILNATIQEVERT